MWKTFSIELKTCNIIHALLEGITILHKDFVWLEIPKIYLCIVAVSSKVISLSDIVANNNIKRTKAGNIRTIVVVYITTYQNNSCIQISNETVRIKQILSCMKFVVYCGKLLNSQTRS